MRKIVLLCSLICLLAVIAVPLWADCGPNQAVANEVIAITRAQWAAGDQKNTAEMFKTIADDYTEFNSDYSTLTDGKAMAMRLTDAGNKGSDRALASEMANPKVQVCGDVAILTYNFAGMTMDKDGRTTPIRAKSTRVYAKTGGKWMLVHANFGADPLPH